MTYRPTEFQVNNSGGIECDIFMDPETLLGGTVYFVIQQDAERVTVSLECLENLLECANELLQARRETRSDAHSNTPNVELSGHQRPARKNDHDNRTTPGRWGSA